MSISHEEFIDNKRKQVIEITTSMLSGAIEYLDGAIELSSLSVNLNLPADDPDFKVFTAIASDIDHLPVGKSRPYWSKDALDKHAAKIAEATEWAKEISRANCESLITRFSKS